MCSECWFELALNPSLLVSLKPGRQRLPWHLWHGLALHCGLNYWWRALLSQCVLPTFKWNSADWAVTASHSLQLLHDIYDVVQIAPKQLISSRACTQNEDPWQLLRAGFSMSTWYTHRYRAQKENIKIYVKGSMGFRVPSSSQMEFWIPRLCICTMHLFLSVLFLKDDWIYLPACILQMPAKFL